MRTGVFLTSSALFVLTSAAAAPAQSQSQNPNYARDIAATCTACHGTEGRSVGDIPPALAGRDKNDLLNALKDFKAGKRPATIMHQHAKGYTDEQLDLIATYFANVKAAPASAAPAARVTY